MQVFADRYDVLKTLGSGGLADVLRVQDRAIPGRTVALKVVRDAERSTELLDEFLTLSRLKHPNLPAVYDYHDDLADGRAGYTLEEAVGQTADEIAGGVELDVVTSLVAGLLRAIAYIHSRSFTHGDVHPRNLICDTEGHHVRLLDLSPGSMGAGALAFQAPERLAGQPPSVATDLFAVGVTLHHLVTGVLPYPDYPQKPLHNTPDGLDKLGLWAPLVLDLMAATPEARPPSAADVLARVESIFDVSLPLVTTDSVRSVLQYGPKVSVSGWPGDFISSVVQQNSPAVFTLVGALGSGRTYALRELKWAFQSDATNPLVLYSSGVHGDSPAAVVQRLMSQLADDERMQMPSELRQTVSVLLSDGVPKFDDQHDHSKAWTREVDQLARALAWVAGHCRLIVLVDDFDAVDSVSLDVLCAVARYIAYCPDEAGSMTLVAAGLSGDAMSRLSRHAGPMGRHSSPEPFDASALETLMRATFLGCNPTHRLVQSVRTVSGGNPLVIGEAVSAAFATGLIEVTGNVVDLAKSAPEKLPVPATARDALDSRLHRVDDVLKPVLALISHAPVAVPASLLGPALDLESEDIGALVETLEAQGLVRVELNEGHACLTLAAPSFSEVIHAWDYDVSELYERLAEINVRSLPILGQVVCAQAALAAGGHERAVVLARTLVSRGMAQEALNLLVAIEHSGAASPEQTGQALGDAHALLGNDEKALSAYEQLDDSDRLIGIFLLRRGRYREGLDRLAQIIEGLDKSSPEIAAETRVAMARGYMHQGEYDAALENCESARRSATGLLKSELQYVEGVVNIYRGEFLTALAALQNSLQTWESSGRWLDQAATLNAIGLVYYRQSNMEKALECFEQTLELATRTGDRDRTLTTLMNVAVVYQERGDYGAAESRYSEALANARVLGHRGGIMKVTQNLGNLYRFLGQLDESVEHLKESLELAQSEGNRYLECHNRGLLGEVAWLRDDAPAAIDELDKALSGFTELGNVGEAADCQRSLAEVFLGCANVEKAREHARSALSSAEATGSIALEILSMLTLAEIELWAADGDLDGALTLVERARDKLGDSSRPDLRWQVMLEQHRVRRAREESEHALTAARETLQELDSLVAGLPEEGRGAFISVKNRRAALRELRWLEQLNTETTTNEPTGKLTRLLDINQRLNTELDLSKLLEYIIDSAILLTGAERGFLLMAESVEKPASDDALQVTVARNIDRENIRNKRYKVSYSIAQQVIESGEALLTTDAMGDDRYSDYLSIHHMKLRSVLCLPMVRKGRVLGALYIDNRFQAHAFTDDDLAFMEAFADQAAIALSNARLLEERQRAFDDLAKSQKEVESLNKQLEADLAQKVQALHETEQMLVVQRRQLSRKHDGYENIVGDSAKLRQIFGVLDRVTQSDVPVLVTGESGTGKELIARAVHYNGARKARPMVSINCASIPETLIESELFGYVRGAFTGANSDKKGVFEAAHGGTLFLDEIGEMPLEMQSRLLRALQEGEIQKVGSPRTLKVDVRVIAATNRNLRQMVKDKTFREDLYYRLAVVVIESPTLRDRIEDLPLLVQHFIESNHKEGLSEVTGISPEGLRLLSRYHWPGNIRELEMAVKNASIFCETDLLGPSDFSNFPSIMGTDDADTMAPNTQSIRPLAELEREAIIHALEVYGGNKKRTAEQLGIDRRTLYNKLAAYGIAVERRTHVVGKES